MIDKIRGVGGPQPLKGLEGKREEKSKGKKVEGEKLSTESRPFIDRVMEEARKLEDIRQELVVQLREAIKSGDYVVKVEEIVKKLLGG